MNYIKKFFLPIFVLCSIFTLFFVFRTLPVSKMWKGYSVLYVPANTDFSVVNKVLNESDCKNVISYFNQKAPFVSEFFPVSFLDKTDYLKNRLSYFFDKNKSIMIYYIQDSYKKNALKAVLTLVNEYSIDAGLDYKTSFPFIMVLICLIEFILFLIFSKNKKVFFVLSISQILFIFSMPFYTNAASVSLFLYFSFLAQKYWKRKDSVSFVLKNFRFLSLIFLAIISSFFASILSGIFFILSVVASGILFYCFFQVNKIVESKSRFNPVLIYPSKFIVPISIKEIKKSFINIFSIFVLLIFYIFNANVFSIASSNDLYFPMPTSYNEKNNIPNLDDYVLWSWNVISMPFKSLNENLSKNSDDEKIIKINRFKNTENGIEYSEEVLYEFNQDFKNASIEYIDNLEYPALEKLMKAQGKDFFVSYKNVSSENFSKINVILMLILIILPCFWVIIYLNGCKKNGSAI